MVTLFLSQNTSVIILLMILSYRKVNTTGKLMIEVAEFNKLQRW